MNKVLHFLPRWCNGGMEHAVLDIISNAKSSDNEYTILAAFKESNYGEKKMKDKGISFYASFRNRKYSFLQSVHALRDHLNKHEYDILHIHVNNAIGLIFAGVAKKKGVKRIVVHTHNNAFSKEKRLIKEILRVFCIGTLRGVPDLYLACSDEAGKWTFGKTISRNKDYHVVYNGIETKKYLFNQMNADQLRESYHLEDKYIVGHIGHFNYQKNQIFIIDLIKPCVARIPNIHFMLIGDGETRNSLSQIIDQSGLSSYVTMTGIVDHPEDYYSMFDLFVLPSHFEGFGIVMLEAQVNGLPVICSDHVSKDTVISDRVKFLSVDQEEASALWVDAVEKAAACRHARNHEPYNDKYNIERISSEVEGYYRELTGNQVDE